MCQAWSLKFEPACSYSMNGLENEARYKTLKLFLIPHYWDSISWHFSELISVVMASESFTPRYLRGWAVALLTVLFQQSSNSSRKTRADGSWILVYWGQYDEATLSSACDKANYDMMVLTILNASGKDQEPPINLSSH